MRTPPFRERAIRDLRRYPPVALGFLVIAIGGCGGSKLDLVPVAGSVTHNGAPLAHGSVVFTPERETIAPIAVGHVQKDGTFEMMTASEPGVIAGGQFVVTVHCRREPTEQERANLVVPPSLIPGKYGDQAKTPLRYHAIGDGSPYVIALE
jgi:hypothetical protein